MNLFINTTLDNEIELALKDDQGEVIISRKVVTMHKQAEKLLPAIDKLLKEKKVNLKELQNIEVVNRGGTFTSLRIGILTANALAYALQIPVVIAGEKPINNKKNEFDVIKPEYDQEPNITVKKKKIVD